MQGNLKWSYVTHPVPVPVTQTSEIGPHVRDPRSGDLVVARVQHVGVLDHLENRHGRRVRLYPGDLIVGAYGNRYATDFYEGYVGAGSRQHLLTAGGLVGTIASAHSSKREPTELEVVGLLTGDAGPLSLDDFARVQPPAPTPAGGTVVVVGSSMNAGKTTTASAVLRGLGRSGIAAGAGKVTGSGSGKDRWSYDDAGAVAICDFLAFGMPSTFGYPIERLRSTMLGIRDSLVTDGADVVVLEIADGLLQEDTAGLLPLVAEIADAVVLAVSDAMSGLCGLQILRGYGIEPAALSGLVTASPLARREAEIASGVPVFSPAELAEGAALGLLSDRRPLVAAGHPS